MIYKSGIGHDRLEDLIAGVTPTLVDWTNDPTDEADLTDGDITTFATTGDVVTGGAWGYAFYEFDLSAFYNVLFTGFGKVDATAGTPAAYVKTYDGAAWTSSPDDFFTTFMKPGESYGEYCSRVRLGITSSAAATITPNIREFHVWRL